MDAVAGDRVGDVGGGHVFGHVAGLEPRHHDVLDAGGFERGGLERADQRALLEHQRALADGMHRGAADGLAGGDRSEFHDAALTDRTFGFRFLAQPLGDLRHDRDRDLRRRNRADIEADRRMDAGNVGVAQALLL